MQYSIAQYKYPASLMKLEEYWLQKQHTPELGISMF